LLIYLCIYSIWFVSCLNNILLPTFFSNDQLPDYEESILNSNCWEYLRENFPGKPFIGSGEAAWWKTRSRKSHETFPLYSEICFQSMIKHEYKGFCKHDHNFKDFLVYKLDFFGER